LSKYFTWAKGNLGLAEFIAQCEEAEIPGWIRQMCRDLRELCQPQEPPPDEPNAEVDVAELI
jgi:putative ATP-dependent endonuclease of OLD family